MRFHLLTLFPEAFQGPLQHSMLEQAQRKGLVLRRPDRRAPLPPTTPTAPRTTYQFGGGRGMVMKPEPVFEAVEHVLDEYLPQQRAQVPVVLAHTPGRAVQPAGGPGAVRKSRAGAHLRPLRRGGRAGAPGAGHAGAERRRLRADRGRAGSHGGGGRGGPAGAGRGGLRGQRRGRLHHLGPAAAPAVHPARRVPGHGGARGPALRPPRGDRPLAAAGVAEAHPGSAGPTCWRPPT